MSNHPASFPFRQPVDWRKLKLDRYPEVVKTPMDLGTISKRLDRYEFTSAESLKSAVELVWSNALLYNGETSWIAKNVEQLRALAEKKFASAERGGEPAPRPAAAASRNGHKTTERLGEKMLTPQMKFHLYNNASLLRPDELLGLRELFRTVCPTAIHTSEVGDAKMDIDALDLRAFVTIDVHVRSIVAKREA
uniref:Bromo domain-containing protein n=1 Tax=Chrysotila carterae TaxID=13221 RepID=A0A7S4BXF0_CHRCT